MATSTRDTARLVWIPSFVALCAKGSLTAAAKAAGLSPRTVRDHIRALEVWSHQVLMDETDDMPCPTSKAMDFLPDALEVLKLIGDNHQMLGINVKRARIAPTGEFLDNGYPLKHDITTRIGYLIAKLRVDLAGATVWEGDAEPVRAEDISF